ncbi:unnamed protein product [Ambrosiozyma monospora]|uniref:Unnamed protein product n=1 Tax=Ambrosiozyma monospora TaxID=43982 RepID=A0ACB5TU10_AMBMO|nr:unnamed protein product [Ambrosiozyma monospora]
MKALKDAARQEDGTREIGWCYLIGTHYLPEREFEIKGKKTYQRMFAYINYQNKKDKPGCPQRTTSTSAELITEAEFKYDKKLDLKLKEKKASYLNASFTKLNSWDLPRFRRWIGKFPIITSFKSIKLQSETGDHQPLINFYCDRLKYILNTLREISSD